MKYQTSSYNLFLHTDLENCRNIGKKDMIHNDATPDIKVNPENYEVRCIYKWHV